MTPCCLPSITQFYCHLICNLKPTIFHRPKWKGWFWWLFTAGSHEPCVHYKKRLNRLLQTCANTGKRGLWKRWPLVNYIFTCLSLFLVYIYFPSIYILNTVYVSLMLPHTNFQIPSSNGSLATAVKQKTKETFCTATILLFYILQKSCLNELIFFNILLPYIISGPYIKWH
jgi:hypothetical protein